MILPPSTDVLVIGGGILGLATAYFLAEDGIEVAIVDRGTLSGTTTNAGSLHVQMQSRFIRREAPARVALVQKHQVMYVRSVEAWRDLERALDADLEIVLDGGLMLAETREQYAFLAEKCRHEAALGLEVAMVSGAEVERIAPYLSTAVEGAQFCANEGRVNTLRANRALEAALRAAGVPILRPVSVTMLERDRTGFTATTDRGAIRASRIVNAAGSEGGRLAALLGAHVPVEHEAIHANVTEAVAPVIRHLVQHAERGLTLKQTSNGNVVVGGGRPSFVDAETGVPGVIRSSIEGNLSIALEFAPWLADVQLIRTWGGINAKTDGLPVVGAAPGQAGHFVAVSGDAGYTLGPWTARILADVMRGRDPGYDIRDFSPARFGRG
ncbi:MAG: FAD-binding oxidoreductase [Alphaproteobacteria bacterium]